jgi:hypothetical protein
MNSGGLPQMLPRERPLRRFEKGQQQRILTFAQRDRRRIGIDESTATPFKLPAVESVPGLAPDYECVQPVLFPAVATRRGRGQATP